VKGFRQLVRLLFTALDVIMTSSTDGTATLVQNTKRNMKAFGSCANAPPAALWFDKQFPPFMNFDQESMYSFLILYFSLPI
jgi:hypothetical protein